MNWQRPPNNLGPAELDSSSPAAEFIAKPLPQRFDTRRVLSVVLITAVLLCATTFALHTLVERVADAQDTDAIGSWERRNFWLLPAGGWIDLKRESIHETLLLSLLVAHNGDYPAQGIPVVLSVEGLDTDGRVHTSHCWSRVFWEDIDLEKRNEFIAAPRFLHPGGDVVSRLRNLRIRIRDLNPAVKVLRVQRVDSESAPLMLRCYTNDPLPPLAQWSDRVWVTHRQQRLEALRGGAPNDANGVLARRIASEAWETLGVVESASHVRQEQLFQQSGDGITRFDLQGTELRSGEAELWWCAPGSYELRIDADDDAQLQCWSWSVTSRVPWQRRLDLDAGPPWRIDIDQQSVVRVRNVGSATVEVALRDAEDPATEESIEAVRTFEYGHVCGGGVLEQPAPFFGGSGLGGPLEREMGDPLPYRVGTPDVNGTLLRIRVRLLTPREGTFDSEGGMPTINDAQLTVETASGHHYLPLRFECDSGVAAVAGWEPWRASEMLQVFVRLGASDDRFTLTSDRPLWVRVEHAMANVAVQEQVPPSRPSPAVAAVVDRQGERRWHTLRPNLIKAEAARREMTLNTRDPSRPPYNCPEPEPARWFNKSRSEPLRWIGADPVTELLWPTLMRGGIDPATRLPRQTWYPRRYRLLETEERIPDQRDGAPAQLIARHGDQWSQQKRWLGRVSPGDADEVWIDRPPLWRSPQATRNNAAAETWDLRRARRLEGGREHIIEFQRQQPARRFLRLAVQPTDAVVTRARVQLRALDPGSRLGDPRPDAWQGTHTPLRREFVFPAADPLLEPSLRPARVLSSQHPRARVLPTELLFTVGEDVPAGMYQVAIVLDAPAWVSGSWHSLEGVSIEPGGVRSFRTSTSSLRWLGNGDLRWSAFDANGQELQAPLRVGEQLTLAAGCRFVLVRNVGSGSAELRLFAEGNAAAENSEAADLGTHLFELDALEQKSFWRSLDHPGSGGIEGELYRVSFATQLDGSEAGVVANSANASAADFISNHCISINGQRHALRWHIAPELADTEGQRNWWRTRSLLMQGPLQIEAAPAGNMYFRVERCVALPDPHLRHRLDEKGYWQSESWGAFGSWERQSTSWMAAAAAVGKVLIETQGVPRAVWKVDRSRPWSAPLDPVGSVEGFRRVTLWSVLTDAELELAQPRAQWVWRRVAVDQVTPIELAPYPRESASTALRLRFEGVSLKETRTPEVVVELGDRWVTRQSLLTPQGELRFADLDPGTRSLRLRRIRESSERMGSGDSAVEKWFVFTHELPQGGDWERRSAVEVSRPTVRFSIPERQRTLRWWVEGYQRVEPHPGRPAADPWGEFVVNFSPDPTIGSHHTRTERHWFHNDTELRQRLGDSGELGEVRTVFRELWSLPPGPRCEVVIEDLEDRALLWRSLLLSDDPGLRPMPTVWERSEQER